MSDIRLKALQASAVLLLTVLAIQLVRLQLVEPPVSIPISNGARVRSLPIEPPRGLIVDRNGIVVSRNVAKFSIVVVPGELPSSEIARRNVLLAIERQTSLPYAEIEHVLSHGLATIDPYAPVTLRSGFDRDAAIALRATLASVPGVHVSIKPMRVYEGGDLLAHVIGYVGPIGQDRVSDYLDAGYPFDAQVGLSGVELIYENTLRGNPGKRLVIADPAGRELRSLGKESAEPGANLVLSIDLQLQQATAAALANGIEKGLAFALDVEIRHDSPLIKTGAAVLMDVHNGELLALVSYPSYNANIFSGQIDEMALSELLTDKARPLIHRAFMGVRSPGSIFKPFVGAAALEEGIATPSTRITSTGAITIQSQYDPNVSYVFKDWAAHGSLDFYGGLSRSSDVYYYYLSGGYFHNGEQLFEGLGANRIAKYARAFGLGSLSGIDLPGEASGLVPDTEWKTDSLGEPWVLGDTYNFGIGQGYLTVTPIQMAVATAALVNGGVVLQPHVVRALQDNDTTTRLERELLSEIPIKDGHLKIVREALRIAADPGGTALRGEPSGVQIGGKTGTAEFGRVHPDGEFDTHGWFLGFAPYNDPQVVVVVYLNHGVGSTHAAPVAREILEAYFGHNGDELSVERFLP